MAVESEEESDDASLPIIGNHSLYCTYFSKDNYILVYTNLDYAYRSALCIVHALKLLLIHYYQKRTSRCINIVPTYFYQKLVLFFKEKQSGKLPLSRKRTRAG